MFSTQNLEQEHRIIERVLNSLEIAAQKLGEGKPVSPNTFNKFLDFIKNFADSCHHGKEEGNLFPVLEKFGVPKEGPIGVMLLEHDQGRSFVKGMSDAVKKYASGETQAKEDIVKNARGYVNLLSQHIPKEDNILYPMANRALPQEEDQKLAKKFEEVEEKIMGKGKHEYYVNLAQDLEKEVKEL